jgi:UDP-N-acetylglucosamine--N-acetylmuramyl-(pentapeptide) pyrophosphoryl-undecaprenol N-acetylglucosamine transferase
VLDAWQELRRAHGKLEDEVMYVGTSAGIEAGLVARAGLTFAPAAAAKVRDVGWVRLVINSGQLLRGVAQAIGLVRRFRPDVSFVTGGYVTIPVGLASWLLGVPLILFLPDAQPGLAVRLLARLSSGIATSVSAALSSLPVAKTRVTGYPVRAELARLDRQRARARLEIAPDERVLLIYGGSRGSRNINRACVGAAQELARLAHVVHITGWLDHAAVVAQWQKLPPECRRRYRAVEYLHDEQMLEALRAADLVVSRAGAATLGELPAAGVPAVLVPYPLSGAHQAINAAVLAEMGAAVVVPDAELTPARLVSEVSSLLADEERRAAMSAAMQAMCCPDAARDIASMLIEAARA